MVETIPGAGRLSGLPAFLAPVGERERSLGRLALFLISAVLLSLLASIVVVMAVTAAATAVMGQPMDALLEMLTTGGSADRPLLSYGYEFSVAGLSLISMAVVWIALAARMYRRPMGSFITAAPRFRWGMFLLGALVAAPIIGVALAVELTWADTALEPPVLSADWSQALGYTAIAAVGLFLAALAEEMVFRGWLLQQTAAFTRNVVVILAVNGLLFSLIHFDPDPGAFAVRAAMGVGWGWIALRLGGLEFATGAHLANNLAVSLLVQPLTLTTATGQESDAASVAVQLCIVLATVGVVEFGLRRNKRGRIAAPR